MFGAVKCASKWGTNGAAADGIESKAACRYNEAINATQPKACGSEGPRDSPFQYLEGKLWRTGISKTSCP